jgi:hypothetical protein
MEITITLDLHDECADENDDTGLTEEAHASLSVKLAEFGDIVDIEKA